MSFSFEVFAPLWLAALAALAAVAALAALAAVAVVVPAIAETHLPPGNVERPTRSNQVQPGPMPLAKPPAAGLLLHPDFACLSLMKSKESRS